MHTLRVRRSRVGVLLTIAAILSCQVFAKQSTTEDPNNYPGSWYSLTLDANGRYSSGNGHGYGTGTWYSYTATGWYRQWFYNQAFDPSGKGHLRYAVYVQAVDDTKTTALEVNVNWTTPAWSQLKTKQPPLPKDAPTAGDETKYMMSRGLYRVDNQTIRASAQSFTFTVDQYCPEWVSIDIRGRNVNVYGGVIRENASHMDFGDAPDTYKTVLSSDGARHTVVQGVYLGQAVDAEPDGESGSSASGDDLDGTSDEDGIVFTSSLSPGESATVEVTASTQGYLSAWVDFNRDGSFAGNGTSKTSNEEQIFMDQLLTAGVNRLSLRIPATAVKGITFTRFRFSTRGLLSYQGPATDGEVEDHQVAIGGGLEPQMNSGKGGLKWSQTPQPFDVATPFILNAWGEPSGLHLRRIAADDWRCDDEGPITGIQWAGSFGGWTQAALPQELPLAFHLALWTDSGRSGAGDPKTAGHPGTLVWETFCTQWVWNIAGYHNDPRGAGDDTCFQFTCLLSQNEWVYPELTIEGGKTKPTVYWLSIAAFYDPNGPAPAHPWAWTTRPRFFGAGAVQVAGVEPADPRDTSWPPAPGSRWQTGATIEHPKGTAWDLAFELLTPQAAGGRDGTLAPVYHFWSTKTGNHFYTISETEKDKLIRESANLWTFLGITFYAYPPDRAPVGSKPVYHFLSRSKGNHFYSIDESEKEKLITQQSQVWTFEGIAWYAFD